MQQHDIQDNTNLMTFVHEIIELSTNMDFLSTDLRRLLLLIKNLVENCQPNWNSSKIVILTYFYQLVCPIVTCSAELDQQQVDQKKIPVEMRRSFYLLGQVIQGRYSLILNKNY